MCGSTRFSLPDNSHNTQVSVLFALSLSCIRLRGYITDWTVICTANWSWHPHQPAPVVKRKNHRARSTKMPPLQSYKRRHVACQHFPDNQTLRLQTGAGEDDIIHLPSGLDHVDCERQEEEETTWFIIIFSDYYPFNSQISCNVKT